MTFLQKRLLVVFILAGVIFALNGCGSSPDSKEADLPQFTNGYQIVDLCDEGAYLKYGNKLAPLVTAALDPEKEAKIIERAVKLIGDTSYKVIEELNNKRNWYYYGDVKNGKPDGYGVVMKDLHDSIIYVGQFEKGVAKGYGCFVMDNVIQFEGYVDEVDLGGTTTTMGVRVDESATYSKSDGEVMIPFSYYEIYNLVWGGSEKNAPVLSDRPSEVLRLAPKYIGEFKKGQYSGKGILYNPDGTILHEGKFENGAYHDGE